MAAHLLTQSGGAQHKIYGGAPGKGGFYKEFVLLLECYMACSKETVNNINKVGPKVWQAARNKLLSSVQKALISLG